MKNEKTMYFETGTVAQLLGSKRIEASDEIMRKMADLNVDWDHLVWELLNNSVQAAQDRDKHLVVDLDFFFDEETDLLKKFSIRDQSGGIPYSNIQNCLQPAKRNTNTTTLNEHGMGLNTAIEYFTTNEASYRLESHHEECSYYTDETISFHKDLSFYHLEPEDIHGTTIVFDNLTDQTNLKFPKTYTMPAIKFWAETCAKYRIKYHYFTQQMGKEFKINMNFYKGSEKRNRTYYPLRQVLKNPLTGKDEWVTSFTLSEGEGDNCVEIEYKVGAAELEKEAYYVKLGERTVPYQMHPYRVTSNSFGFDLIYQSIVMSTLDKTHVFDLTSIANNGDTWGEFSALRGEITIIQGMTSFFVKNGLKTNPIFERLNERARDILTGKAPHPMTGEKIDFMKSYIHRRNNSKAKTASEVIIKHRLRKNLEIYAKAKVTAEENGAFGRIDLLVEDQHGDQEIIEVKKKKTKPDDVLQTFKYLLFKKNIKTAKLMAPEHSDDSTTIVKEINAFLTHSGQKILLETLDDHLTNPSLSESEKNFLNNT